MPEMATNDMPSEQQDFLSEFDVKKDDVLTDPLAVAGTDSADESDDSVEQTEKLKNRAFRRLEQKYQEEREASIALNERLKVLSEVGKFRDDVGDDTLKEVEAIFGTDTPEKAQATNILKKALSGMSETAVERALERFNASREDESGAVRTDDRTLDRYDEHWEDEYGIDMSDDNVRRGMYALTERLSSKDEDGNIREYADPDGVAEMFLAQREKASNSRAKELASRSSQRGGASSGSKIEQDAMERALKDAGII
jgi:hypothetical protein